MTLHIDGRNAAAGNSGMLLLTCRRKTSHFGVIRECFDSCGSIGGEVGLPPCCIFFFFFPHLESARESLVVRQDLLELDLPAPDMLAPARHSSIAAATTTTGGGASGRFAGLRRDCQHDRHSTTAGRSVCYGEGAVESNAVYRNNYVGGVEQPPPSGDRTIVNFLEIPGFFNLDATAGTSHQRTPQPPPEWG